MAVWEGICRGGPLDGQPGASRFPAGFLLVDKPRRLCWVYDWLAGRFYARTEAPEPLREEGPRNRWRAAEEARYDVRAFDARSVL
jgi:hypothetical protein